MLDTKFPLSDSERYYLQPIIEFYYQGKLIGKQRARKGRGAHFYTPKETVLFEKTIGQLALAARQHQKIYKPFEQDVAVDMQFYFANRSRLPDTDNIVKAVLDGMQHVIYHNDKQVAEHRAKRFIDSKFSEGAYIQITPIGDKK